MEKLLNITECIHPCMFKERLVHQWSTSNDKGLSRIASRLRKVDVVGGQDNHYDIRCHSEPVNRTFKA